jgi:hypothetical protein
LSRTLLFSTTVAWADDPFHNEKPRVRPGKELPGTLVLALRRTAEIGWRWWTLARLLFGIAMAIVSRTAGGAMLAPPPTLISIAVAERVWGVVERPARDGVVSFVALAGFVAPALTRILDLSLRCH